MSAVRRTSAVVAFLCWLFCWSLLRDARTFFDGSEGIGGIPVWVTGLLGLCLLLTIGTTFTAAIKLPVWPWLAIGAGIVLFLGTVALHLAHLEALQRVHLPVSASPWAAFTAALQSNGLQPVFFLGGSGALVATGIYGRLNGGGPMFVDEPRGANPNPVPSSDEPGGGPDLHAV